MVRLCRQAKHSVATLSAVTSQLHASYSALSHRRSGVAGAANARNPSPSGSSAVTVIASGRYPSGCPHDSHLVFSKYTTWPQLWHLNNFTRAFLLGFAPTRDQWTG